MYVQGAEPPLVGPDPPEDFDHWKKALTGRKNVEFKLYPKYNHLFFEGEGLPSPIEYTLKHGSVAPQVIEDIAAFILKTPGGR